nr:hypothetical protein [Tanacetum cinerariifolium]
MDDFVEMDDVWDNLDYKYLTNEGTKSLVKPEFLSSSNRIHLHSPYNLQITCKIGFINFDPYIEPQSPFNIMSQKDYNSIMKHELEFTGNNMAGFARNLHVFIGGHQLLIDFIILENINEFVEEGLTKVIFGQPFKEHVGIVYDRVNGVLWFKIRDDKTILSMPCAKKRFGVARPKIEIKDNFELKCQVLKELCTYTFSGLDHEDANEHIEKFLEIINLFHIPNITIDQVMLRAFPMSLTKDASRWLRNKPTDENLYQEWERFKELLMKCPQHYLMEMQEVILFYNGLGIPTRQILDSRGVIPSKTAADAKIAIQEMAKYSQK